MCRNEPLYYNCTSLFFKFRFLNQYVVYNLQSEGYNQYSFIQHMLNVQ